jgi:hypothetical protein
MTSRTHLVALAALLACGGNSSTDPSASITLTLRLDRTTLVPGEQTAYTVSATRDGQPVSGAATVQSDNPDIATVSSEGVVSAIRAGRVNISATLETAFTRTQLEVLEGGVISPAGGRIRLTSGRVELAVPAGAVTAPVAVTIVPAQPPTVDPTAVRNATFAVSPDISFAVPATIRITYDPSNAPIGLPQGALGLRRAMGVAWTDLVPSLVDSSAFVVTAAVNQTGTFGIGRHVPDATCAGAEHRHFDFWLGEWNMTDTPSGQSVGTSTISREPGGCAVYEEYVSPTPISPGRSISFYEPNTKRWYQQYIDAGGNRAELASTSFSPTSIVMRTSVATAYKVVTWSRVDANTVTQVSNITLNGGQSFTPEYNLTYRRKPGTQPSAATGSVTTEPRGAR